MNNQLKRTLEFALSKIHFIVIPVVLCTFLAVIVALFGARSWSASQALFIRDDSIGADMRGGRFDSVDMMQVSQETILQIAQHPTVLRAALEDVGPVKGLKPSWLSLRTFLPFSSLGGSSWPSDYDVENLSDVVSVKSPKGTQFGRTEVIYINVTAKSNDRAAELARAVSEQLGKRMMKLREDRYASVSAELAESVVLARRGLNQASKRLRVIEKQMGSDLAELRVMMNGGQGEGNVRRVVVQLEGELRGAIAAEGDMREQIRQFTVAANQPELMLAIPNTLLDNQPGLRRLKEGLSEAQLRTSTLMGVKNARHPDVIAARESEQRVKAHLQVALANAVDGLRSQLVSAGRRVAAVQRQLTLANGRMGGVAALRTEYSNLSAEVSQRVDFLKRSSDELSLARGNELSARSVSLIHLLDQPITGTKPVGPGRVTTVLAGAMAGLMIGGSLIFLMLPVAGEQSPTESKNGVDSSWLNKYGKHPTGAAPANRLNSVLPQQTGERRGSAAWSFQGRRMTDHPGVQNSAMGRRNVDAN